MEYFKLDDLRKFIIKTGKIVEASNIEGSEKLLRLIIDFGDEKRQILSGIAKWYKPEDLIGKQIPAVVNLEPRKFMGIESQGMVLMSDTPNGPVLLHPFKEVPNGSPVL